MSLLLVIDRQFAVDPKRCTDPSGHRALSTQATCRKENYNNHSFTTVELQANNPRRIHNSTSHCLPPGRTTTQVTRRLSRLIICRQQADLLTDLVKGGCLTRALLTGWHQRVHHRRQLLTEPIYIRFWQPVPHSGCSETSSPHVIDIPRLLAPKHIVLVPMAFVVH